MNRAGVMAAALAAIALLATGCTTATGTGGNGTATAGNPAGTAAANRTAPANGAGEGTPLSAPMGGNPATLLRIRHTASGTVVTDGTGYTLYWFSRDSATASACDASCDSMWPPVTGEPRAAPGTRLTGSLGVFTRADGTVQATLNGHPLYTYAGDFEPGDVGGNGITQYDGRWYAIPAPG